MTDLTNPDIDNLNEQYASKISKGEITVGATAQERESPSRKYDRKMREKKLSQAAKEKAELQKKLAYVDKSIETMKMYDFASGQNHFSQSQHSSREESKEDKAHERERLKRYKEQRKKLQEAIQQTEKRRAEREKVASEEKEKQREAEKIKRKNEIYENMQKIKQQMEKRQQENREREQQLHKVKARKTLLQKMEEQSKQRQNSLLDERKKKLASIRNMHKPVTLNQIEQHQRSFIRSLKEKEDMRERERRLSRATQAYQVSYKSPMHQQYSRVHESVDQSRIKAEKMRQFSQHVKKNFVPEVDEGKREKIDKFIEEDEYRRQKQQERREEEHEQAEFIRSKGLRYLQELKEMPRRKDKSKDSKASEDEKMHSPSVGSKTERPRYKNYIEHKHAGRSSVGQWRQILSSSSGTKEKALRMKVEAEKMESSLQMKEQKVRLIEGRSADEVDQEYFDMVRAKLDLLQMQ